MSGAALDLAFAKVNGRTVLTRRRYRWPLLIGRVFTDAVRPSDGSVTIQNAAGTVIPGDLVTQRIEVLDGGSAVVRGQGATMVSGIPGGDVAIERTDLRVDATSGLWFNAAPRILTPHAHYRQHTRMWVAPGGFAVLVDAVVLHPDLTDEVFGSYESTVEVSATEGRLLARDAQLLEAMPRVCRAPSAFATIYAVGTGLDTAMTALMPDLEALAVHRGARPVYVAMSDLPNGAGWAVRIAAADGGVLRSTTGVAIELVEAATAAKRKTPDPAFL